MIRLLPLLMLGALIAGFSTSSSVVAADKEKTDVVKLEGTICCGKCELKQSAACAVTIVVTKDGKKTTYWLDAETSKKYH
ncbi:MAG: hypothetical protein K8T89_22505, partial [Planctomycetes bacterium]|nr:hypothetical protein [Planctomycetota bacterium]